MTTTKYPILALMGSGVAVRIVMHAVLLATSRLEPFDASHLLYLSLPNDATIFRRWASTALRWDALHFSSIAANGYLTEQSWAFFPGTPLVMRIASSLTSDPLLAIGLVSLLANLCSLWSTYDLYSLTLLHTRSLEAAFLAAALSTLPSSPVTFSHAPYAEPFFAFFSYRGMVFSARKQWNAAATSFIAASAFRSNGLLLGGFLIWGMVVEPLVQYNRWPWSTLPHTIFLTASIFLPFLFHQYTAYTTFCVVATTDQPEWCRQTLPSIYSFVQGKYWNVGFLKYWELPQIPNFAMAAPPLLLLLWSAITHLKITIPAVFSFSNRGAEAKRREVHQQAPGVFVNVSTTPHAIHALIFSLLVLFTSHVQIVLRLAASTPFLYWSAARLLLEHSKLGKWWVGWSIIWGLVGVVNWGVFLPPA